MLTSSTITPAAPPISPSSSSTSSNSTGTPTGSFPESLDSSTFSFSYAAAPDIIRATQKDTYFQTILHNHVTSFLRKLYGSRLLHQYTSETKLLSDFLYLALTTLRGSRTLGEEYCDIVHVDSHSPSGQQLPRLEKRAGFVATMVLVPYILTKLLPRFRAKVKGRLDRAIARGKFRWEREQAELRKMMGTSKGAGVMGMGLGMGGKPVKLRVQEYLRDNLDMLTSGEGILALNLGVFYFSGAYYHLAKRIWGLRYIFTKRLLPHEQRVGYEVLGVLLITQLMAQAYFHITTHLTPSPLPNSTTTSSHSLLTTPTSQTVSLTSPGSHTTPDPQISLEDEKALRFIEGELARKCTLCLSPMTDPTATQCGHVFCWGCIEEWCRTKPECPLCRQPAGVAGLLPLRG